MKMRYIKYLPGNLALKKSWIVGHYDVVRICQQQSITKKKIGLESVELLALTFLRWVALGKSISSLSLNFHFYKIVYISDWAVRSVLCQ